MFDLVAAYFVYYALCVAGVAAGYAPGGTLFLAIIIFAYQSSFLARMAGATPGKRVAIICVISVRGGEVTPKQAITRGALTALPYFALAAGNLDVNVIAHGLVAMIPVMGIGYLLADLCAMEFLKSGRTVTDRLAQTLVVTLPPVQPHRAPAVPMFSRNDAEFGVTPLGPGGKGPVSSNPSIERTPKSQLRCLSVAAHVER